MSFPVQSRATGTGRTHAGPRPAVSVNVTQRANRPARRAASAPGVRGASLNELALRPSQIPVRAGAAAGLLPLVGSVVGATGTPATFLIGAACPLAALVLLPVLVRGEAAR